MLDSLLKQFDISIKPEQGGLYCLNDLNGEDFEPKDIITPHETLNTIINWPTAGWIEYESDNACILVSFEPSSNNYLLIAVYITIRLSGHNRFSVDFNKMVSVIHKKVKPFRTIMGEDIFDEYSIDDTIKSLLDGSFNLKCEFDYFKP